MLKLNNFQLNSERCIIRLFQEKDIRDFMLYRNDEEWMKFQEFKGLSYNEYHKILLARPCLKEGIQLAIIEKRTQKLIGDIYLQSENHDYWIGYTIAPWMARKGYGYEALSTFLQYLFENHIFQIFADIDSQNEASLNLIKKLGFIKMDNNIYMVDAKKGDTK